MLQLKRTHFQYLLFYTFYVFFLNEPKYLQKIETVKAPYPKELQEKKSIVF